MALATIEGANPTTRLYTFIASTGQEDRNKNIFDADGWELGNYMKNPIVLENHNWAGLPIGAAVKVWTEQQRLQATIRFADTPRAREVQALIDQGILRTMSVGHVPLQAEVRRDSQGWPIGMHSHRQELVELSITSVPANPDAIRIAALMASGPEVDPAAAEIIAAIRAVRTP